MRRRERGAGDEARRPVLRYTVVSVPVTSIYLIVREILPYKEYNFRDAVKMKFYLWCVDFTVFDYD